MRASLLVTAIALAIACTPSPPAVASPSVSPTRAAATSARATATAASTTPPAPTPTPKPQLPPSGDVTLLNTLPPTGQWAIYGRRSFAAAPNAARQWPATDSINAVQLTVSTGDRVERRLLEFIGQEEAKPQVDNLLRAQLSPDRRRIVLSVTVGRGEFARLGLVVADLVTGFVGALTTDGRYHDITPAWSPTGDQIAFARTNVTTSIDGDAGIWVVNADGTGLRQVLAPSPAVGQEDIGVYGWNGDGTRIGFRSGFGGSPYRLLSVADSAVSAIGDKWAGLRGMADWRAGTPAFVGAFAEGPLGRQHFIVTAEDQQGRNVRTVATGPANANTYFDQARWRPGANEILYVADTREGTQAAPKTTYTVYVADGSGGAPRAVKKIDRERTFAAWTADGKDVVILRGLGATATLVLIAPDGSNERVIQGFALPPGSQVDWIDLAVVSF
jgi:hypothetical protein